MNAVKQIINFFSKNKKSKRHTLSAIFIALFFSSTVYANCEDWVARVVSIQGAVEVRTYNETVWQPAKLQQTYCEGDVIRVNNTSRAALELHNETIIRLNQNSTLVLSGPKKDVSWLDLLKGSLHAITRVPRSLKIKTPFVNAAVEGTEFQVRVKADNTIVGVIEGMVAVSNEYGRILLAQDQTAITYKDKAPTLRLDIKPADSVHWSLYYPRLNVGSLQQAEDLISAGQITEAETILANQTSAEALSLKTIIAIATNQKQQALALAKQAVQTDKNSVAAHMAHSYALQANFDLPAALKAAKRSVQVDNQNGMAWARLSELRLSLGDINEGLAAAKRAVELKPELSRTQAILGFAHLLQYETSEAKQSFKRSIELDSSDPLARLGNGLATIREGDLTQGRREIEIAASLDTNNSLIRSYLGKAYFEEKRNKLAADQFTLAKLMDPKDPTPWLYSSVLKKSENNPVGALNDLQQSIALNKNRAVFRSSLNIDNDLATKNVGQAHLYDRLGLSDVAKNFAAETLMRDPANHSAHRFLSDAYASRPRHEIARSSALLQSQLLQPLGLNPVQPQNSETNLNQVKLSDSVQQSFNEYSSSFVREGVRADFSMLMGNNSLNSDEFIFSGLSKKWSYSVGQFHHDTEGFRPGANIDHDIYNAFVQAHVTDNLDIQLEYRDRETAVGDLRLNFVANPTPSESQSLDQQTTRLGARLKLSPESNLLFSVFDIERSTTATNILPFPNPTIISDSRRDATDIQLQYIRKGSRYNLIAGLGKYDINVHDEEVLDFGFFATPPTIDNYEHKQQLAYLYGNFFPQDDLLLTAGVSFGKFEHGLWQQTFKETDPKLGLIWNVSNKVKLRAAGFKTLKRVLLANQTLEPVQIAGFNQFYDDANAAQATVYGIGLDVSEANDLKYGFEYLNRDVTRPQSPSATVSELEHEEKRFHFYWSKVINSSFSLSGALDYDQFTGSLRSSVAGIDDIKTTIVPITAKYFATNKFFTEATVTYVKQRLELATGFSLPETSESFGLLDFAVGYHLPKRGGVFSLGVKNVLDEDFLFQDENIVSFDPFKAESRFFPTRTILLKMMINLK